MEIVAQHTNARMTPRKVRALREVVIGLPVAEARSQLLFRSGKAAGLVAKVLASATANAKHNNDVEEKDLTVAALIVNEGIRFKRFQPVSRGTAHPFEKRACHIRIVLETASEQPKEKKKTDITTLTVEELASVQEQLEEEVDTTTAQSDEVEDAERKDANLSAYDKMKMQQRGGDRKKTHRRKSI